MRLPRFDKDTNPLPFDAVNNPKGARVQNNTGMHRALIRNRRDGRGKGIAIAGNTIYKNPRARALPQAHQQARAVKNNPGQPWINAHDGAMRMQPAQGGRPAIDVMPVEPPQQQQVRGLNPGRPALPNPRDQLMNKPLSRFDSMDPEQQDLFKQMKGFRDEKIGNLDRKIKYARNDRVGRADKKFFEEEKARLLSKMGGNDPLAKFQATGSIFDKPAWRPSKNDLLSLSPYSVPKFGESVVGGPFMG